jgi:hypothetical protein
VAEGGHPAHDLELIAAVAAGELDEAEQSAARAAAIDLVESCQSCRELAEDLALLTMRLRESASVPARAPRDFRIREPAMARSRPTSDMTNASPTGGADGALPTPHQQHDLVLVSAYAAGDLAGAPRRAASDLVAGCPDCARLAADLVAIAAAGPNLSGARTAPRDFRLSAAQADRLRRRSWRQRLTAAFGPQNRRLQPIAATFTSLGVAGLLLVAVTSGSLSGATASLTNGGAAMAPAAPVASAAGRAYEASSPGDLAAQASNAPVGGGNADSVATPRPSAAAEANAGPAVKQPTAPPAFGPISGGHVGSRPGITLQLAAVVGSTLLLVIGLALFGLRAASRRIS